MKKFIFLLTLFLALNMSSQVALAKDTVNMFNGTVLKGTITRLTSEMINMKTKFGARKFTRNQVLNNRDFIEVGFAKKRIITGKIFVISPWFIEMKTPEGLLKIYRYKIRNIVLGHVHEPEEQLQIQLPEQLEKNQRDLRRMPGGNISEENQETLPAEPYVKQKNLRNPDYMP